MSFQPGQDLTAERLNRFTPRFFYVQASASLDGPASSVLVPGCSVTFTTTTANAIYEADIAVDFDLNAAATALCSARLSVDGTLANAYAVLQGAAATDRGTAAQHYQGTLAAAGSHTLTIVGTVATGQSINVYTTLRVKVYEVV